MFGIPKAGQIDYTRVVELDLGSVTASVAGPRRPQDRIELGNRAASRSFSVFLYPTEVSTRNRPIYPIPIKHPTMSNCITVTF